MSGARESDASLDDLRRRLYGPQATEDDLARYAAERDAQQPAPPDPVAAPRSRRAALLAGGVLLAGGALALGVRLLQPAPARPASVRATRDLGAGAVAAPATETRWSTVAVSIDGTGVVGRRTQGYGDAVVAFDAPAASVDSGRALVAVTSTRPDAVRWQAILRVTRQDWSAYPVVMASGPAQDRSGAHAPAVFGYASHPPDLVAISAPAGVGWTLVTAVAPRPSPQLH